MATSRKGIFESGDLQLATWAMALAHPARIAILRMLARRRMCTGGEIVAQVPLPQAAVAQHLRVLKAAGLIEGEVGERRASYAVNEAVLADLRMNLDALFQELYLSSPCYN
jgi:ArsR family transcriptional regulator